MRIEDMEYTQPYAMRMLNESGDTAIEWDEPDDIDVLTFIQKKMDEGYVFFIEQPRILKAFMKHKRIKDVRMIKSERKVIVADADARHLVLKGKVRLVPSKSNDIATVRKAKTAGEVAASRSVATRPLRGG